MNPFTSFIVAPEHQGLESFIGLMVMVGQVPPASKGTRAYQAVAIVGSPTKEPTQFNVTLTSKQRDFLEKNNGSAYVDSLPEVSPDDKEKGVVLKALTKA